MCEEFVKRYRKGKMIDLRKGAVRVPSEAIGIVKLDKKGKATRRLLFADALSAWFPDRKDRERLIAELKRRGIIKPNPGRSDANTIPVQIDGETRKAYWVHQKTMDKVFPKAK